MGKFLEILLGWDEFDDFKCVLIDSDEFYWTLRGQMSSALWEIPKMLTKVWPVAWF